MAGKFKFKVPMADEMGNKESEIKPMSLFENYKKQKEGTSMEKTKHSVDEAQKQESTRRNEINTANLKQSSSKPIIGSKASNNSVINLTTTNSTATTPVQKPVQSTDSESSASNTTETKAPTVKAASSSSIIVNFRQRGNPILKHIRNVPWEYSSIIPDYVMGKATCALYLSLRYHQLNPSYIHNRLKELGKGYDLRVLLAQVDVKDPHHLLKDLAKICILADLTLILAFSPEEAGRYLETYKVYENKPPDVLMEKIDKDYISKLTDTLTSVKSVNKTDSVTLLSTFKTMQGIINASKEDLSLCAGFGPQKAQRLHDVFHEPFLKSKKRLANTSTENDSDAKKKPR